ncbi:MAG: hypothetical protein KC416_12825, partial [Myxococcales bacterium]|nr:hypothetical protein [Myxococcales bacterium]
STNLVADTFLRFKGLERPAVVITDLSLVSDRYPVRMHIALTRALTTASIVASKEVLSQDPIFASAVS